MPLITLFLSFLFVSLSIAGYTLQDDYSVDNFFDMFSFFTDSDPTNGFVQYVDQTTAQSSGLIGTTASTIYIGTDHSNVTPNGRPSVRLTSNTAYNSGSLVILDLAHMPGGICGTWPAFWMVGPNWPEGGEIDIVEGVNLQTTNAMTLHTGDGCSIDSGNFTGSITTDDCYISASGQSANAGCSIDSDETDTYGTGFNNIGGGVYAMEWTDSAISVWFFPRSSIPSDVSGGSPDPSTWGEPQAQFQGGCDIPEFFSDNQIVFDLTYCGDWAGEVWGSSSCSSLANTCNEYVENNPSAFENAYWSINSLQVFQYSDTTSYSSSSAVPSSTSSAEISSVSIGLSLSIGISTASPTSSSATSSNSETSSSRSLSSSAASSTSDSSTESSTESSTSSSTEPSTSSSSNHHWGWGRSSSVSSNTPTSSSVSSSASVTSTITGGKKAVSRTTTASSLSQTDSVLSSSSISANISSSSVAASLSSESSSLSQTGSMLNSSSTSANVSSSAAATAVTTHSSRKSEQSSSTASVAASTVALSTSASADVSYNTAVPTSLAEMVAKVEAMADEWSSTQPSDWQDEINAFEDALEAAASQAAAVSAKLKRSQRRHLLHHKRRFSGHY